MLGRVRLLSIGCVAAILAAWAVALWLLPFDYRCRFGRADSVRQRMWRMRQILIGLANYHETFGWYPPPTITDGHGRFLFGWRYAIVPFVTCMQQEFRIVPDSDWNSAVYTQWRELSHPSFCSPGSVESDIVMLSGVGTLADPAVRGSALPNDLIVLLECDKLRSHWMAYAALDIVCLESLRGTLADCCGSRNRAVVVGFIDGEVWAIESKTPAAVLRKFVSVECAARWDRERELRPYCLHELPAKWND